MAPLQKLMVKAIHDLYALRTKASTELPRLGDITILIFAAKENVRYQAKLRARFYELE
jgi:hypothetical protein